MTIEEVLEQVPGLLCLIREVCKRNNQYWNELKNEHGVSRVAVQTDVHFLAKKCRRLIYTSSTVYTLCFLCITAHTGVNLFLL